MAEEWSSIPPIWTRKDVQAISDHAFERFLSYLVRWEPGAAEFQSIYGHGKDQAGKIHQRNTSPLTLLQAVLDAVTDYAKIGLEKGTYTTNGTLTLPDSPACVWLAGESMFGTKIAQIDQAVALIEKLAAVKEFHISDLTLDGNDIPNYDVYGVRLVPGTGVYVDRFVAERVMVVGVEGGTGFALQNIRDGIIDKCYFQTNSGNAIYALASSSYDRVSLRITNSLFYNNLLGILINQYLQGFIDNCWFAMQRGRAISSTSLFRRTVIRNSHFISNCTEYPTFADVNLGQYGRLVNSEFWRGTVDHPAVEFGSFCDIIGNRFNNYSKVFADIDLDWPPTGTIIRNNKGYNPVGKISTPFLEDFDSFFHIMPFGNSSVLTANQEYTVRYVDVFINCTGGTGVSITIKDASGNTLYTGLTSLIHMFLPAGYRINFGAFTVAPTVTVVGN